MLMWSIIASIIFTLIILVLTLVTIQQGYGYKHTIDPPAKETYEHQKEVRKEESNH